MELIYKDFDLVLAVKPVGVSSEAGPGSFPEALEQELGGQVYPIHRLDLNVGGLMVYARTKAAAAKLSQAVQEGRVIKEYLAAVHGTPEPLGTWEDLLWKDSSRNKVFAVKRERKGVKKAKLSYRVLETGDGKSLAAIRLYTGRSHQIRVQFSSRGFPLLGDHKYGSRDQETAPALWSFRLTLPHPQTGKAMTFTALPSSLGRFVLAEGLEIPSAPDIMNTTKH